MPIESEACAAAPGEAPEVSAGADEIGDESVDSALELLQPGLAKMRRSASA